MLDLDAQQHEVKQMMLFNVENKRQGLHIQINALKRVSTFDGNPRLPIL
jgi:hypothetical protein